MNIVKNKSLDFFEHKFDILYFIRFLFVMYGPVGHGNRVIQI